MENEFGKDLKLHFEELIRKYDQLDDNIKKEFQNIAKCLDDGLAEVIIHHGRSVLIYKGKIVASSPFNDKILEDLSTIYKNSFIKCIPTLA